MSYLIVGVYNWGSWIQIEMLSDDDFVSRANMERQETWFQCIAYDNIDTPYTGRQYFWLDPWIGGTWNITLYHNLLPVLAQSNGLLCSALGLQLHTVESIYPFSPSCKLSVQNLNFEFSWLCGARVHWTRYVIWLFINFRCECIIFFQFCLIKVPVGCKLHWPLKSKSRETGLWGGLRTRNWLTTSRLHNLAEKSVPELDRHSTLTWLR